MRPAGRALTLLRGALGVLAAGWLEAGSCHVSYSSCTHDRYDCSAPQHDRKCPCSGASSAASPGMPDSFAGPPRAIAFEVEVDAAGRSRVRRWLVTERGAIALDRAPAESGWSPAPAPFTAL